MRKRGFTIILSAALCCSFAAPALEIAAAEKADGAQGTTYYVSTLHGKDRNNGTSRQEPFYSLQKINDLDLQPGDRILLESGSVFEDGYLHLFGQSGSEEAPIVIDRYGEGADPLIRTNGQGVWYQNYGKQLDSASHVFQGYVSSSVLLYDTEYIEIRNLEIENRAPRVDTFYNAADVMNRTGVAAVAQDKGTIEHIYLDGLNIHDVNGNVYDKHMNNGGIYFTVFMPHNEQDTGIARYDDVKIENCSVINTNRWGIAVGYTAYHDQFTGREISDSAIAQYGATNVVVRNNYVKDAGGDGITMMYCDRPLVEYNVSDGVAKHMNTEIYANPGNRGGRVAAAVWPWKCKDALFQYNEVFDTQNGASGNGDAQAWDADSGDGTLYQYNYSHGNTGGCVMFCYPQAYQNTFRYNISQGDLMGMLDVSSNPDAHVYNNVFYIEGENVNFLRADHADGSARVENNIIYYAGEEPKTENWQRNPARQTYSNNLYYNYANVPESDANAVAVEKGEPVFVNAGSAPVFASGVARLHYNPGVRSEFDGYKLVKDSPAIGAGIKITDANGKELCQTDFFGNEISASETPDIGAHKYQSEEGMLPPPAPQITEAAEATENTVVLSWPTVGEMAGVAGYKIMNGSQELMDITNPADVTDSEKNLISVRLENLEPGTTYTIFVVAYDAEGTKSEPAVFTVKTAGKEEENPGGDNPPNPPVVNPGDTNQPNPPAVTPGGSDAAGTVTPPDEKPTLKVKKSLTVKRGKKKKLNVKTTAKGKITYKSSNKKVAAVTKKGVVTGKKKGSCKITIRCGSLKAVVKVKVK